METIRKATETVYKEMPKRFHALQFCEIVRKRLSKKTMDGTILRRLRELRADGIAPYRVADNATALYEKCG